MTSVDSSPLAVYGRNKSLLDKSERETAELLFSIGQEHLFEAWKEPGYDDSDKKRMLAQVFELDQRYPGGLKAYVTNSRRLLQASSDGLNPYAGYTPSVPNGQRLAPDTTQFHGAEQSGLNALAHTAFVLVAGGLGERLGYNGIKVSLPVDLVSNQSYLQHYITYILEYQRQSRIKLNDSSLILPLAIMTSDDTHDKTMKFLGKHDNFGMMNDQITIIKQEKVPALMNNSAHFAVEENDAFNIVTKPHGHGDVHILLHQKKVIERWNHKGIQWIVFFQDTNALVFRSIPAVIGISVSNQYEMNSITVPRRPGEAVGSICKLMHTNNTLTINVEYNQLDPLLRATISPQGDIADESGFSPYPGNINAIVLASQPYLEVLQRTNGSVPEFVNPKYADANKMQFKKPTRLECMMQDYPKLLNIDAKVGFTQVERWMAFSAVKNNTVDALSKLQTTGFPECASSGEAALYEANRRFLRLCRQVNIAEQSSPKSYASIPVKMGAKIVLSPSFGITQAQIASKMVNAEISISSTSTLMIEGDGIIIKKLVLEGALIVRALNNSKVILDDVIVSNKGWSLEPVDSTATTNAIDYDEVYAIRGYRLLKHETKLIEFTDGLEHVITIKN